MQSVLESKLAKLYGELAGLQSSLAAMPDAVPTLFRPVAEHHLGHVTLTREMLSECCHDLMCLSLLVPSVPWVGVWCLLIGGGGMCMAAHQAVGVLSNWMWGGGGGGGGCDLIGWVISSNHVSFDHG